MYFDTFRILLKVVRWVDIAEYEKGCKLGTDFIIPFAKS
jgi:hypothetical protein